MRVKICGVTTTDDARHVAAAGADFIGVNLHPPSRRFIDPVTARSIMDVLPPSTRPVGLFVDRPSRDVAALARDLGLSIVQLHGDEPADDLHQLRMYGIETIKAFRIGDEAALHRMVLWLDAARDEEALPDFVLIDADVAGVAGGSGKSIPLEVLRILARLGRHDDGLDPAVRTLLTERLVLAGGLTPENVRERIDLINPWMVDVASGVESAPGRKDEARVRRFVETARGG